MTSIVFWSNIKEEVKLPDNKSLAELIEELHQRYEDTVSQLSSDPEKWAHFLSKSSYNFRLRFDQQVLLYAQAPDATIVATSEQWYKMYRPIRANSKWTLSLPNTERRSSGKAAIIAAKARI